MCVYFCFLEPKLVSSASVKHCYYTHDYTCITSHSPLEVQEIPLHYDVPVYDFWDFFHVYMFLQILQSYYIFCIYNFILFCIYLLTFLQSIKVHVNVYILPSINTLALRCVKIINWILFLQTKYSFWIKVIR